MTQTMSRKNIKSERRERDVPRPPQLVVASVPRASRAPRAEGVVHCVLGGEPWAPDAAAERARYEIVGWDEA